MSATSNQTLTSSDGWTKVATDPNALTVKCNSEGPWALAITSADSNPTVRGEVYDGPVAWTSGPITGYVWIKATTPQNMNFAITE